ncbi:sugar ABC transporter substrate-binding protein [Bradyrhizobium centrolobii]|uniref:Sugar ABC transporter substrate-binding protein n=1 Tax=Bradyrhizobium centrolobii TaxID=1505087 RepID=A0A176YGD2_9BRAD|nr:extracellular solute-binding protein [Bradyrhizobium centrolobii]OAF05691.1 sugar ABC transporter substrate-binding protein [Bradyrhizobium centrolobii]
MARITRRRVLKLSGAGLVAAKTGGLAAIVATGLAPAYAQGTNIHWLRWADFVPASDVLLKGQITQECKKATGITLNVETINANDLQSRITSAIQSRTGADITMAFGNWPQLYTESLADAGDVAEEIGKAQGGYYDVSKLVATVGNKWIGVPWAIVGGLIAYRKSWFEEIGYNTFPETWDALLDAGKKLKAKGRPIGQTAGHTFGDAPSWWYPYLWSWGGKEVEADGKTVVLNSRETIESVKFAVGFWKDTCDEGGLAWDDTNNNRAFLSGTISATNNGASIYIEAKRKPEAYLTEKGAPMWNDILHARIPKGPGGQFNLPGPFTDMLMGYSKNQKAAKDFLRWMHSKPVFAEWFTSQQGYADGATRDWEKDKVWEVDPVLLPFRDLPPFGRLPGYAGPPNRKAAEVVTKYIITDMYAKAIQGMPAEDAVKWAHDEVVSAYA